jgi:hypothetical protein
LGGAIGTMFQSMYLSLKKPSQRTGECAENV